MLKHAALALAIAPFLACSSDPAPSGPAPGTVVDEGNYTLTVLAPATAGACDAHAEQPSHFTDVTDAMGLSGVAMSGFYSVDLDHDGFPDLVLLSGTADERGLVDPVHPVRKGPDVLVMMNRPAPNGSRRFVDETEASGLFQTRDGSTTQYRSTQLLSFADVDNDGNLDAFSGIAYDAKTTGTDRDEILLNDGRGHFTLAPQSDPSADREDDQTQAVFVDVDQDGVLDLFVTDWWRNAQQWDIGAQAQLFRGNGDGTFANVTQSSGLEMDNTGTVSSVLAGKNSRPAFGTVACDLNDDGYPELLVSAYGGFSNVLWKNQGDGTFARFVQPGGYDGDTNVDYHDNQMFRCYCASHASDQPYCAGAAAPTISCSGAVWNKGYDDQPALLNGNNFSADCGDIDGDGKPDVFQGTIRHWWAGNNTDPPQILTNATEAGGDLDLERVDPQKSGVTFPHLDPQGWNEGIQQATLVDMDNDGRTDILTGGSDYAYNWGHLFIQQGDATFQDLAQAWGLQFPCMDGLAVADFDRDGDLDVVVRGSLFRNCYKYAQPTGGWAAIPGKDPGFEGWASPEVHIFRNDASDHAQWLEVRLAATDGQTNRMGLGASVSVTVDGVTQTKQMLGAHGIGSESDDPGVLFFGLGACGAVDQIQVRWPNASRTVDTWTNVPADHLLELRQSDTTIYAVNL